MKRERFDDLLDSLLPGTGRVDVDHPEAPPFPVGLGLEPMGVIGRGGQGWVYRARDPFLDRMVAVKIARPELGSAGREALLTEARVTASLEHPAVLPVHRVLAADGLLCVEFRLAPSTTLARELADTRSPDDPAWPLGHRLVQLRQIADAIAVAHARGLVHGDLHPGNVALGEGGDPYVMDWGGVAHEAGTFTGQAGYAAPEQLAGGVSDGAGDVYALGAIAWELCTIRPLRPRRHDEDLATYVMRWRGAEITPPSTIAPVEAALEALILEALARDPRSRPKAEDFVARLDTVLTGSAERERRQALADGLVEKARSGLELRRELERRIVAERQVTAVLDAKIPGHAPIAQKRALWEAQDRIASLVRESEATWLTAAERATTADTLATSDVTRQLRAETWWEWMRYGESTNDRRWAEMAEPLVRHWDTGPLKRALEAPSHLTLEASVPGARVTIARFVERDRRLVPVVVEEHALPLARHPLAHGSWLLTVRAEGYADTPYPVWLDRMDHHRGRVKLFTQAQIGEGWCYVPGGQFRMGGDPKARQPLDLCSPSVGDRFVMRTCVTTPQWMEFLEDLGDPAARYVPGERGLFGGFGGVWRHDGAQWRLPEGWDPRWPIMAVSFGDAEAYAEWLSRRLGCLVRLPTEEEWEKAARGVDGRSYPWGDGFDPTYTHMRRSVPEAPHPAPAGSYPVDCSVYGVMDMAGGMREFTASVFDTGQMVMRGGTWGDDADDCRCACRSGIRPEVALSYISFRLIREEPLGS